MSEDRTVGGGHDFVRPFIMTGGRTSRNNLGLQLETLVRSRPDATSGTALTSEQAHVVRAASSPVSVAELAAELDLVVGVVKVLIEDLVESGQVEVFPVEQDFDDDEDELDMLNRISEKIRSL